MACDKTKGASGYKPPEKYRPKPAGPKPKPEKVPGFTVASFFGLWAIFAVKYVVDFLLLPKLLPGIYPLSVWAIVVWAISTLIFSFISIEFVSGFSFFDMVVWFIWGGIFAGFSDCRVDGSDNVWGSARDFVDFDFL